MSAELSATAKFVLIYVVIVSVVGVILTVYDKAASKKNKKGAGRVPENTLMYLGVLGGALPILITMRLIRHKTKHRKFMIGLPVISLLQIVLFIVAVRCRWL